MSICIKETKQNREAIDRFKEEVLGCDGLERPAIVCDLNKLVGLWATGYNRIRGMEMDSCFSFTHEQRTELHEILNDIISIGCDLLLILHYAEDAIGERIAGDLDFDFEQINRDVTNSLRALKLSRSAYSQSIESIEENLFTADAA